MSSTCGEKGVQHICDDLERCGGRGWGCLKMWRHVIKIWKNTKAKPGTRQHYWKKQDPLPVGVARFGYVQAMRHNELCINSPF